jgi:hypothetical protein
MQATRFLPPELRAVSGAPAQGQRVDTPAQTDIGARGWLTSLSAEAVNTPFGEGSRRFYRWRGRLPDGIEPEPGWEVEVAGRRFRVTAAQRVGGGPWRLELEGL